jgi:hypothetical protein
MSAEIGTTEAAQLVTLRERIIADMETAEKESNYRWYLTAQREVRRIESKLAKLERWAAQAA